MSLAVWLAATNDTWVEVPVFSEEYTLRMWFGSIGLHVSLLFWSASKILTLKNSLLLFKWQLPWKQRFHLKSALGVGGPRRSSGTFLLSAPLPAAVA
jgi:hypothetical protein